MDNNTSGRERLILTTELQRKQAVEQRGYIQQHNNENHTRKKHNHSKDQRGCKTRVFKSREKKEEQQRDDGDSENSGR